MKNIIRKISQAVQVLLLAPVKLPGKALHVIKYVALGIGLLESLLHDSKAEQAAEDEGREKGAQDEKPQ